MSKHVRQVARPLTAALGVVVLFTVLGWQDAAVLKGTRGPSSPPSVVPSATASTGELPNPIQSVVSVVEGNVAKVWTAFDPQFGPRTFIMLADMTVHAGSVPPSTTFSQLGGPTPDGGYLSVSELPRFSIGARYILFLGNRPNLYTPLVPGLTFRVENLGIRSIVLGHEGRPVLQFGPGGAQFGERSLLSQDGDIMKPSSSDQLAAAAASDPQASLAMTREDFVATAKLVTAAVAAPLGGTISLEPPPNVRWDLTPTSPQVR